jgi:predicted amidohydrolase
MLPSLTISIIQPAIVWEDKAANIAQYNCLIDNIKERKEVIILPEMFSTGFSMAPERLAERMDGETVQWMAAMAEQHRIIITGSIIIEEEGKYYNRLIWMQPDGTHYHYDKRHLFGYGEEDQHYHSGDKKLIVQVKGWKICPLVCYDLRFPVWARNAGGEYDVLLYVANWPQRRSLAWKTLLQARAIENQAYCIGVNRVGEDGAGIVYSGDSAVFDPLGNPLLAPVNEAGVYTITLEKAPLSQAREHFPFLKDADKFLVL